VNLFDEDESYTDEALNLCMEFEELARHFLSRHSERKLRELHVIMDSAVNRVVLDTLIRKRLE